MFFFQAEDGIRDLVRSRGLGDVYKRQGQRKAHRQRGGGGHQCEPKGALQRREFLVVRHLKNRYSACLLYTSDAADERSSVDLGGRRIINKKKK